MNPGKLGSNKVTRKRVDEPVERYQGECPIVQEDLGKIENVIACLHASMNDLDNSLEMTLSRIYKASDNTCFASDAAESRMTSISDLSDGGEAWICERFRGFHEKLNQIRTVLF